jgi:hypothetical protein
MIVPRLDLTPYVQRLARPGYALQIGTGGARGKTTHLLWLRDHFPQAPYLCFEGGAALNNLPESQLYFLDQFQLLPLRQRLAILRKPASFAIISHRRHVWEFWAAGLRHELVRLPNYPLDAQKEILDRRIAWATLDPALPRLEVSEAALERLWRLLGDENRIVHYLYDRVEVLAREEHVHIGEWDSIWE